MTKVLVDLLIVEAAITFEDPLHPVLPTDTIYFNVFAKHGIKREQYEQSLKAYSAYPELADEIYDQALNELSKQQALSGH